jgi:hypothetical protein
MARPLLLARARVLAIALASAALLTSATCHLSVHSDPDGGDPKNRPCPPSQPGQSAGGAPELPLEAYRILRGRWAPLPELPPWAGWSLEDIEGPPALGPRGDSEPSSAHREFGERLAEANPSLFGPGGEFQACGTTERGTWTRLAYQDSSAVVILAFDERGRLARIERR